MPQDEPGHRQVRLFISRMTTSPSTKALVACITRNDTPPASPCVYQCFRILGMKVLTCSDLHLRRSLYAQLADAVAEHKPDVLALVGDYLDLGERRRDTLTAAEAALELAQFAPDLVVVQGNHDSPRFSDFENAWQTTGRELHSLHGSAIQIGGLNIVGFPCWMGCDEGYAPGHRLQNYHHESWLPSLMPAGRALWLMHEPPTTELSEEWLTVPEWRLAIEDYQPLVVVCGHDHNTPRRTKQWSVRIGRTQCINLGQRVYPTPGRLLYATLDFVFAADGSPKLVKTERHG